MCIFRFTLINNIFTSSILSDLYRACLSIIPRTLVYVLYAFKMDVVAQILIQNYYYNTQHTIGCI